MESRLGPIEEMLKNELEDVVRDAHETLTRNYLKIARPRSSSPKEQADSKTHTRSTETTVTAVATTSTQITPESLEPDVPAQYCIPPETASTSWPDAQVTYSADFDWQAALSDSAYYSLPTLPEDSMDSFLDDTWYNSMPPGPLVGENEERILHREQCINVPGTNHTPDYVEDRTFAGKGKRRATHTTVGPDTDTKQPD